MVSRGKIVNIIHVRICMENHSPTYILIGTTMKSNCITVTEYITANYIKVLLQIL